MQKKPVVPSEVNGAVRPPGVEPGSDSYKEPALPLSYGRKDSSNDTKLIKVDHDPWAGMDGQPDYEAVEHDPFGGGEQVPSQIYFARHGSTSHNRGGVGKDLIRGWADIPLSEQGRQEAQLLAEKLKDAPLVLMYTSDLSRAKDTADAIAQYHKGIEVIPTDELRSWNMGPNFEGEQTSPEIVEQIKELVRNPNKAPKGGEAFDAFLERVVHFADPIVELIQDAPKDKAVCFVGHGRIVQVMSLWIAAGCEAKCMSERYATSLASEPDAVSPGGYIGFSWEDGQHWVMTDRFSKGEDTGLEYPDDDAPTQEKVEALAPTQGTGEQPGSHIGS